MKKPTQEQQAGQEGGRGASFHGSAAYSCTSKLIYCAGRNNWQAFVFATFCTITRTPHLVGGPMGF